MGHTYLIFGCLFYRDHVLSLNLSFELLYDRYTRQKLIGFKQELLRQTVVVINYNALFSKK